MAFSRRGRSVLFAEHVFYSFRDDKIEEVWALLDTQMVAGQLAAGK